MSAQSGDLVKQLASNNGLCTQDTLKALGGLIPGMTKALGNNTQQAGGLEALFGALQKGNHDQYLDHKSLSDSRRAQQDGNNILGHLFGGKQGSRSLASQVSSNTGLDSGNLKKMLPIVATLVMGAMSKQSQSQGRLSSLSSMLGSNSPSEQQKPQNMLMSFLDMDKDGSVTEDIMSLAAKFLLK